MANIVMDATSSFFFAFVSSAFIYSTYRYIPAHTSCVPQSTMLPPARFHAFEFWGERRENRKEGGKFVFDEVVCINKFYYFAKDAKNHRHSSLIDY